MVWLAEADELVIHSQAPQIKEKINDSEENFGWNGNTQEITSKHFCVLIGIRKRPQQQFME